MVEVKCEACGREVSLPEPYHHHALRLEFRDRFYVGLAIVRRNPGGRKDFKASICKRCQIRFVEEVLRRLKDE